MVSHAAGRPGVEGETGNRGTGESGQSGQTPGAALGCTWSPDAERRLERIPEFIRPMARQGVEQFAVERGYQRITEEVMEEARGALGM